MQTESIEQKIRKIQDLFLDQVEIRLSTSTEIDEKGTKYHYWVCDAFYEDDNFHDYDLDFVARSNTNKIDNISSSGLTACSDVNFSEALDNLYNECLQYLNHNYHVCYYSECSNEPIMIAIASSLDSQ